MKKLLIISFSEIRKDPRVLRQIQLLKNDYELLVAGYGSSPSSDVRFFEIHKSVTRPHVKAFWAGKLLSGMFEWFYWGMPHIRQAKQILEKQNVALIIANDVYALPLALKLANGRPVHLDAHEYSPREFEEKPLWRATFGRLYHYICRRYLSKVSSLTTVAHGIADEYRKQYGVAADVVYNAPTFQAMKPQSLQGPIRLIHHGAAISSRHLEVMIEMMGHLPEAQLDFMLVETDPRYFLELKTKAAPYSNIRFIPPVGVHEICEVLNRYDVGVYLLPPVNFNHANALPNKFFEFVQARLAIAIGPSQEMASLLNRFQLGVVADNFSPESLAQAIAGMTREKISEYKRNADVAASSLCFEKNGGTFKQMIDRKIYL